MNPSKHTQIIRKLRRLVWRGLRNRSEFARIAADPDPSVAALGRAVRETVEGTLDEAERSWVSRIEALRGDLCRSERVLDIPILGTGDPGDPATAGDRFLGRSVQLVEGEICRVAATKPAWAILFLKIMRRLKPERILELGTSLGISAAYNGAGIVLNGQGRMVTLEGAESLAERARENLRELGIEGVEVRTGWFNETLEPALKDLGTVDYAFIDGHHYREPTLDYFERIYPYCSDGALLVFDDISYSAEMEDAWRIISADPRIGVVVDLFKKGYCFVTRTPGPKRRYRLAVD